MRFDGGRLKLEWGVLNARPGQEVEDLVWWDEERVVGFAGLYAFGPPDIEIAGMVDPQWRRRGIATALLDSALPICRARGFVRALLVVPRASEAGRNLALARGALDHAEHGLDLFDAPLDGPSDRGVTLRTATRADVPTVSRLLAAAFGGPPDQVKDIVVSAAEQTLLIDKDGSPIGTVRLTFDDAYGGIYGFAIDPQWQGRGIGRDVLRRLCHQLRSQGVQRVHLEVAVDNDRALGLYTSIGFRQTSTEDYYTLPLL